MTAIIKTVKRYGNSGGVYLPADWIGGTARIELVNEPADPRKDLLKLPLEHVVCIIIYGSYARGEMTKESDIDAIIVTDGARFEIPSWISRRYEISSRTVESVRNSVENDPVFCKVINDESIALFNAPFLEELKTIEPKSDSWIMRYRIETAESSLNVVKSFLELSDEYSRMAYPLVMRLKEMLFIECFISKKKYTTSLLKKEIMALGISAGELANLLSSYRAVRDDRRQVKLNISEETIAKLAGLLEKKISYVKQKTLKKRH